jgi:sentrin-specific protease 1
MNVGFCLERMESQEENNILPILQRDNTLSVDESLLVCLSHNKQKNWWSLQSFQKVL